MVSLTASEVASIAEEGKYNLIPIYREIPADLETPIGAYLKVQQGENSFLLESVKNAEQQQRYSFIGTEPYKVIKEDAKDPLVAIEAELGKYREFPVHSLPDFTGGGFGYISYDCVRHFEPSVKIPETNNLGLPESIFLFTRSMIIFDHARHVINIVAHIYTGSDDGEEKSAIEDRYNAAVRRIDELAGRLAGPVPVIDRSQCKGSKLNGREHKGGAVNFEELQSSAGPDGYANHVRSLKKNIFAGDIIQAVPSHRYARPLMSGLHPFDIYRHLRSVNPSPYMFYVDHGTFQFVGASPEQLVKVVRGRVTTHPIAGTRARGRTPQEDEQLTQELKANIKEKAEHIMLVDLGRNDLGRVAKPGTVTVDSLMHIEKYSHVMHIVSHVSGQLDAGKTVFDAFRSVFPAGTVSGAPKVRALQLIAELEQERRGLYAGSLGYVSYNGTLDTCIAIRTILVKDNVAYLQAGGGIVFDSVEEPERKETIKKMRACAVAIDLAEEALLKSRRVGLSSEVITAVKNLSDAMANPAPEAKKSNKRKAAPKSKKGGKRAKRGKAAPDAEGATGGMDEEENGASDGGSGGVSMVDSASRLLIASAKSAGLSLAELKKLVGEQWE